MFYEVGYQLRAGKSVRQARKSVGYRLFCHSLAESLGPAIVDAQRGDSYERENIREHSGYAVDVVPKYKVDYQHRKLT